MRNADAVRLHTLLGNYPVTLPLKEGRVGPSAVTLDFADVKSPQTAFKRVVRDLEFDAAELAIDYVHRQRLIPRHFTVDELFDDVTRALGR